MLLCSASVLSSWEGEGGEDVSAFLLLFFLHIGSTFVACCPRTNTPIVLSFVMVS